MTLHSLFISNSKHNPILIALRTSFWAIVFLILIDISINILFPYPKGPVNEAPGQLTLYFDYGRSIESKIRRLIGDTDKDTSIVAFAGWLKSPETETLLTEPSSEKNLLLATYGMSFSSQVSEAAKEIYPQIDLRLLGGPAAPANHTFTIYNLDRNKHKAKVVMFGIMSWSVKGLDAISSMNLNIDGPAPFTMPKYRNAGGKLEATWPEIQSLEEMRIALKDDPQKWESFVKQMSENEPFFDSFSFRHNWSDNSAMLRLVRRAWAKKHNADVLSKIQTKKGFNPNWKQIPVLKLMVQEFGSTAKADGRLPIVLLVNNQGDGDILFQLLKETLEQNNIPYVSTHTIAPPDDPKNFIPDGHFTHEKNLEIAQAVLKVIKENIK